ncbi:MAG: HD domain-containing phosphohydrolase [Planctomycetota bacterium]
MDLNHAIRILIVDDDDINLDMLRHILTESGYAVDTARGGREAWEALSSRQHRMVISDWEMPDGNGLDLCRRVRENDAAGYTYFILLTHRNKPEDIVRGMANGADDFITKPFNPDEVRVRVRAGERSLSLESRDIAIFAMAKLAESRDPETGGHLERIQGFSRILAERLLEKGKHPEITTAFVRTLFLTVPLHDIGKVGIPDSVLLKPSRLTDDEFDLMKTHTTIGANTLKAALQQYPEAEYLKMAHDIALTHHEKYDGTGYPNGRAGNDIPMAGRIAALVDVYDAVSSSRVYKRSFNYKISRDIIIQGDGSHFDPELVKAFLEIEDRFIEIRNQFDNTIHEDLIRIP